MGIYKFSSMPGSFSITLEGLFTPEETDQFVSGFMSEIKKIQPSKSELIFDVTKFQILPANMHETLKNCFQMYQSFGFKKILIYLGGNAILGMQVRRIATEAGMENYELK